MLTLEQRFWAKVEKGGPGGCWLWKRSLNVGGYGQLSAGGRPQLAHRISYELLVGPIPEGLTLDHLCRVRSCVNPAHLEPVSIGVNVRRGMGSNMVAHRTGFCPRGHELAGHNLIRKPRGSRVSQQCRACFNASRRRSYQLRKAGLSC